MIDKALGFIKDQINTSLKLNLGDEYAEMAKTSTVLNQDGSVDPNNENSIIVTLVNIEEERMIKSQGHQLETVNGKLAKVQPDIKLNLYLLFASNFKDYNESLKFLSYIVTFFQVKNVFDATNSPSLNSGIQKIIVDLYTISLEQQNNLWGSLGAKYMPSVIYKLRMLIIQDGSVVEMPETISGIAAELERS